MTICPSCHTDVNPVAGACPGCNYTFRTAATVSPRPLAAVRPKVQASVHLAITIDRTGSSAPFAAGVEKVLATLLPAIASKARELRVTLWTHGDLDEGQNMILLTDRGSPDQAIADARTIRFEGGGDPPEHHLDAIEHLLNSVDWVLDPAKGRDALVLVTTADSKPARSGRSATAIGRNVQQKGILLYAISEHTPAIDELVRAAGGLLFPISNDPPVEVMTRIAAQLAASIVQSAATGATRPLPVAGPQDHNH